MKKNYPFSKKAVKAMLVAALALTPVAGYGGAQVAAAEVETQVNIASYAEMTDLINRFNAVYDGLTPSEQATLKKVQNYIKKISDAKWNNYAKRISNNDENLVHHKELLKDLATISASSNIEELSGKVVTFISKHDTTVDTVFGNEITVEKLLKFIADTELEYLELRGDLDEIADPKQALEYINTAIANASEKNPEAYEALTSEVDLAKTLKVLDEIRVDSMKKPAGGGGGGGGGPIDEEKPGENPGEKPGEVTIPEGSTETVKEGNTVVTQVPAAKVSEIVNQITNEKAVISLTLETPATGETVKAQIPAELFTKAAEANKAAAVNVKTEAASYELPVSEINVAELATELGAAAADVKIEISVNVVPQAEVKADLDNNNLNAVSDVIEFTVKAVSGDKEVTISKFSTFVKRTITGNKSFNADRTAAVKLADGKFQAAPATFDGKEATIFKRDNSKYVIVENDKTFADVNNGANFFEDSIEKLASKYIINGKTDISYAPSDAITRGEFAALISRSLGLVAADPTKSTFTDVSTAQAVNKNGEINAAVEAGIIKGFPGNVSKPEQPITRAEAAIMIDRALGFTNAPASKFDSSKKITDFKDGTSIGTSSSKSIEKVVQAGIMGGFKDGNFGAYEPTQRDQMAKVLDKFLKASNFIN